jgi:hypothetical protein
MSPLSSIPPRLQRAVVPYVLVVLTLIAIGTAVTFRVQADRDAAQSAAADAAIHHAAIQSCHKSNEVRRVALVAIDTLADAQIDALDQQIKQSKAIPPKFFPAIPPKQFQKLINQQTVQQRATIADLHAIKRQAHDSFAPTDCLAANPRLSTSG